MIVIMMGVSGSGKTTLGTRLARKLHCQYLEGDLFHPPENIDKMSRDEPLDDADRLPWLEAIHEALVDAHAGDRDVVVGCSALKASYRALLEREVPVRWVYLTGDPALLHSRLEARRGHFVDADLLASQLATLEVPTGVLTIDVSDPPDVLVDRIFRALTREPELIVSTAAEESSSRAARFMASFIRETVAGRGRCLLALSGGDTPRKLYRLLGDTARHPIPWEAVHLFWCDERYVPPDDPRSNYGMIRDALLDHVPCPPGNIHRMPTDHEDPREAAEAYEQTLRAHIPPHDSGFDFALLGLGGDGHTASLFPGHPALQEERAWVMPVTAPVKPPLRLTLTLPLLVRSDCAAFLVSGGGKAEAVVHAINAQRDPVGAILRSKARSIWWLDTEAAAGIDRIRP